MTIYKNPWGRRNYLIVMTVFFSLCGMVQNPVARHKNKNALEHHALFPQCFIYKMKQNLAKINSAQYDSFITDCTPDISHIERLTMFVHLVDVIKNRI